MKKSAALKIPIWEINNNTKIKEYAKQIIEINIDLRALEIDLKDLNTEIDIFNNRINIYLSNIFNTPNFKHGNHVIAIMEGNEAHIFKKKDVVKNGGNIKSENIKPVFKCQLNEKQITKIISTLHEYNDLIDEFDEIIEEYELALDVNEELWQDVKTTLKSKKFLKIYEEKETIQIKENIEEFDEDRHLLVIIQDKKDDWNFKYIRKEDESEFNKFIDSETKKIQKKQS